MTPCNRRGLSLNLSACTVGISMMTVSSCGINFSNSSQWERNAKTLGMRMLFHSFILATWDITLYQVEEVAKTKDKLKQFTVARLKAGKVEIALTSVVNYSTI